MTVITKTQLENASEDADDLGHILNDAANQANPGHATGTVTTRLGQTTKNIARVISDVAGATGTVSTTTSETITSTQDSGLVFVHDPVANPANGGYKFGIYYGNSVFNNGPPGEVTYNCDVWRVGANANDGDVDTQRFCWQWESHFWDGAAFGSELHLQVKPVGAAFERRPFSIWMPEDGIGTGGGPAGRGGCAFAVDYVNLSNYTGGALIFSLNVLDKKFDLNAGAFMRVESNNTPAVQQQNSVGAFINLPFINSNDQYQFSLPVLINTGATTRPVIDISTSGAHVDGDPLFSIVGGTGTGSIRAIQIFTSAATFLESLLQNQHASGSCGFRAASTGDAWAAFTSIGTNQEWRHGIDVSDSDKFKLSFGAASPAVLGTTDALVFSVTRQMSLPAYGAGALTTDASGNVTAASDERLKNVLRPFMRGLDDLRAIGGADVFQWLHERESMPDVVYAGFISQKVRGAIPEAVGVMADGMLTLHDRPILAAAVNGLLSLEDRVAALESMAA